MGMLGFQRFPTNEMIYRKDSDMDTKSGLYAIIGGIVGAVLTMAVCSVMPLGAQNGDATFGTITCTELVVRDAEGNRGMWLTSHEHGGVVAVGSVMLDGIGFIGVQGEEGNVMLTDTQFHMLGKEGVNVVLTTTKHGGRVSVGGKGNYGASEAKAAMSVNKYGDGRVSTWNRKGGRLATLK